MDLASQFDPADDMISPGCCLEALTEQSTFCQVLGMPILRFIGYLRSSSPLVCGPTVF